jgi:hypothetical protein
MTPTFRARSSCSPLVLVMEQCAFCKAEDTALYENGVPICLKCVAAKEAKAKKDHPASIHNLLVRDLTKATLRAESASYADIANELNDEAIPDGIFWGPCKSTPACLMISNNTHSFRLETSPCGAPLSGRRHLYTSPHSHSGRRALLRDPPQNHPVAVQGRRLEAVLDGMNVEFLLLAHEHINWETGEPDKDADYAGPGRSTHRSAFAAAVGKKLGVYLLRPPEHGQILLANAQAEWFRAPGARRRAGARCALRRRHSHWRIKGIWL